MVSGHTNEGPLQGLSGDIQNLWVLLAAPKFASHGFNSRNMEKLSSLRPYTDHSTYPTFPSFRSCVYSFFLLYFFFFFQTVNRPERAARIPFHWTGKNRSAKNINTPFTILLKIESWTITIIKKKKNRQNGRKQLNVIWLWKSLSKLIPTCSHHISKDLKSQFQNNNQNIYRNVYSKIK